MAFDSSKIKVGTKFKNTDKALKVMCEDCFGPIETHWDCDEMKYERSNNLWEINRVYGKDENLYSAKRVLEDNSKATIIDFIDDVTIRSFEEGYAEIVE